MVEIIFENLSDTKRFGEIFSSFLKTYDIVCLDGDLGAGKTTLSKSILAHLGVKEEVTSPTFTLIETYQGKNDTIYHVDVYRLSDRPEEIFEIGLDEYLASPCIVLIEWSSLIKRYLPKSIISLNLERLDDSRRKISVEAAFENQLMEAWKNECPCS